MMLVNIYKCSIKKEHDEEYKFANNINKNNDATSGTCFLEPCGIMVSIVPQKNFRIFSQTA